MIKNWEYQCVWIWGAGQRTTSILNEFGKNGWELVDTQWCWHYFKRPIN